MSFFFDGVSEPDKEEITTANDSLSQSDSMGIIEIAERVLEPQFISHTPYKEKECAGCHDQNTIGRLLQPLPGLCYQCHDDMNETYGFLHGPVGSGNCTQCHSPHLSKLEKLLLRSGQELCLYCHNSARVFKNEKHKDIGDANCTKCHNPHGGENRAILKGGSCYECHEDFNKTYSFLHGPVAGGHCTACHGSHITKSEKLLLRSGQQICLHCHDPKLVFENEDHADIKNTNCTKCHNPHGGEDRYILASSSKIISIADASDKIDTVKKTLPKTHLSKLNLIAENVDTLRTAVLNDEIKIETPKDHPVTDSIGVKAIVFRIQIRSSKNPIYLAPVNFRGLKNVEEYFDDGIYKYVFGAAYDYGYARDVLLNQMRSKGFKDAFIVVFMEGNKISVKKALELLKQ